jgi:carboxymethylenebutenolidase
VESGALSFLGAAPGAAPGAALRGDWVTLAPEGPGEVPLRGWWAQPRGGVPRAGLLVLPEVFGLNPWVRGVAEGLAALGYGALAVPLFARTAPDLCLGYGPSDLAEGRSHKDRTTAPSLLLDVARAQRWLRQRLAPGGAVGCIGFCFGGHVALLASGLEGMAASCVCYGAGVVQGRPGGGPPSLEVLGAAKGRVLLLYGREDPLVPPEDLRAIETAVEQVQASRGEGRVALRTYAAGHGFLCQARGDFQPEAAQAAWSAILPFLATALVGEAQSENPAP